MGCWMEPVTTFVKWQRTVRSTPFAAILCTLPQECIAALSTEPNATAKPDKSAVGVGCRQGGGRNGKTGGIAGQGEGKNQGWEGDGRG